MPTRSCRQEPVLPAPIRLAARLRALPAQLAPPVYQHNRFLCPAPLALMLWGAPWFAHPAQSTPLALIRHLRRCPAPPEPLPSAAPLPVYSAPLVLPAPGSPAEPAMLLAAMCSRARPAATRQLVQQPALSAPPVIHAQILRLLSRICQHSLARRVCSAQRARQ